MASKSFLVRDRGIRTKLQPFDPTEDGGVGADAERKAQNRKHRKAGAAPQHAETDAEVEEKVFEPKELPGFAGIFAR